MISASVMKGLNLFILKKVYGFVIIGESEIQRKIPIPHVTGFTQRRLDYFLVSNNLQESINKMDILTAFSKDHSPVFFYYLKI